MTRTKKFKRTRFKPETFRVARTHLDRIAKATKKTQREERFAVRKQDGELWRYDGEDAFFAAYSAAAEWAYYCYALDSYRFKLEVDLNGMDTEVSVSAEKSDEIDSVMNLFIEVQLSATLEDTASLAKPTSMIEPPTFSCWKRLPSCHVDRTLVEELESYMLAEAGRIAGHSVDEVRADYSISIIDQTGNEVLTSAKQLEGKQFHNSTSQIALQINHRSSNSRFRLTITFDWRRHNSELRITVSSVRARENTAAFVDGVIRRLAPRQTFNWLYLSNDVVADNTLSLLSYALLLVSGTLLFVSSESPVFGAIKEVGLLIGLGLLLYVLAGRIAKPYSSFETLKQLRLNKWSDWLFWSAMAFLLFGTVLTAMRRRWFGF